MEDPALFRNFLYQFSLTNLNKYDYKSKIILLIFLQNLDCLKFLANSTNSLIPLLFNNLDANKKTNLSDG